VSYSEIYAKNAYLSLEKRKNTQITKLKNKLETQLTREVKLVEALKFYANEDNWMHSDMLVNYTGDGWTGARATLKELGIKED
jgi:hypothetical protein